jgi:hypothetical protein
MKHKWYPFKFYRVQHLKEHDLLRRVEFCEFFYEMSGRCSFLKNIIWTDEAKFSKNGLFNRHNIHYWALENPRVVRERNFQESWQFNVFCAIKNNRVL